MAWLDKVSESKIATFSTKKVFQILMIIWNYFLTSTFFNSKSVSWAKHSLPNVSLGPLVPCNLSKRKKQTTDEKKSNRQTDGYLDKSDKHGFHQYCYLILTTTTVPNWSKQIGHYENKNSREIYVVGTKKTYRSSSRHNAKFPPPPKANASFKHI